MTDEEVIAEAVGKMTLEQNKIERSRDGKWLHKRHLFESELQRVFSSFCTLRTMQQS
jgi:hypothetical protein